MWHLVSRGTCGAFLLRFAFSFAETVRDGRGKKSADAKKRVYVTFCVDGKERPDASHVTCSFTVNPPDLGFVHQRFCWRHHKQRNENTTSSISKGLPPCPNGCK